MFRVIIAGGRTFNSYSLLKEKMDTILKNVGDEIVIISGTASGADKLGESYAAEKGYKLEKFPADWSNMNATPCVQGTDKNGRIYNKLAGHNRNQDMINVADAAVYFWDTKSTGTADCIRRAKEKGIKVRVINY